MNCTKVTLFFLLLASSTVLRAGEKAYLHLDNSAYFLGDTIRMAAYVMDTDTKQLTNKSKVLYVEMLAPEGYILERRTYLLENGECAGDIAISPLVVSGLFEIRAYTRYMQNDGQTNYYSQVVPIYEPVENGQYQNLVMQKRQLRRKPQIEDGKNRKPMAWVSNYKQPKSGSMNSLVVEASYDDAAIAPYGLTTIKLRGMPNAHLSLSITDADNYIHTSKETINDFVNGSIFHGKMGMDVAYEPEQEIMLYGKAGLEVYKRIGDNYFTPLSNCQFNCFSVPLKEGEENQVVADAKGNFKIGLGNLSCDSYLLLTHNPLPSGDKGAFIIDYDLDPPCKFFTKKEMQMGSSVVMGEKKLPVKQQKIGSKILDVYHVDIIKMIDKVYNNYSQYGDCYLSLSSMSPREIKISFDNFYFLDCCAGERDYWLGNIDKRRSIVLDGAYPGDNALPISHDIRPDLDIDIRKFKEMVVRTDKAIRTYYDFSKGKRRDLSTPSFGQKMQGEFFGAGSLNASDMESGIPSIISCFVPDTNHEWDDYLKYNNIPGCRYIKVSGFSMQLPYRLPNYSKSHPQSDYRRTLYWNPSVQLDANGEATIQFFNNGTCKKFVISGEGVSEDGKAIVCQ